MTALVESKRVHTPLTWKLRAAASGAVDVRALTVADSVFGRLTFDVVAGFSYEGEAAGCCVKNEGVTTLAEAANGAGLTTKLVVTGMLLSNGIDVD